jgi:uncharacterized lipoprotein
MKRRMWIAALCLIGLAGCSSDKQATRNLSERERDSLIARSVLPGAAVVGRAMAESDRAALQAARQDTMFSSP